MPDNVDATLAAIDAEIAAHQRRTILMDRTLLVFVLVMGTWTIWVASGGADGLIRQHYRIEARP